MSIENIKLLLTIKNTSSIVGHNFVIVKQTIFNIKLVKILYKQGLIQSYTKISKNLIKIFLRKPSFFNSLKIISKPSIKIYLSYIKICQIKNIHTICFFSTNKGILTQYECKTKKIGGKLLFIC